MPVDAAACVADSPPAMRDVTTSRLLLEPQCAEHADEMFALLQDPALYRYENEAPQSVERLRERFARLETRTSGDASETWLNWVVRLPGTGLIGFVQATVHPDDSAGIAYVFGSAYWGRGYAFEAVHAMLRALADRWHVQHFRAVVKRENARSLQLLARLGFAPAPREDAPTHDDVGPDEISLVRKL